MQGKEKNILDRYFEVLEKRDSYGMAMPLTSLPSTKSEIKNAIKSAISSTGSDEERDRLKKGYITLSEFIPDMVLEKVDRYRRDAANAECEVEEGSEAEGESDVMSEVVEVQKSIADEGARLAQEMEDFLSKTS